MASSLNFARVMTHVLFFHVLSSTQQHVDAVLSDGKMLTRDCVDVGGQLGPHYVEEQLVVLSCLHSHVVILSLSTGSCALIVCRTFSCTEMNSLKLIQSLMLYLSIALQL